MLLLPFSVTPPPSFIPPRKKSKLRHSASLIKKDLMGFYFPTFRIQNTYSILTRIKPLARTYFQGLTSPFR